MVGWMEDHPIVAAYGKPWGLRSHFVSYWFSSLFIFQYFSFIYLFIVFYWIGDTYLEEITLELRLRNYSPVTVRWVILQLFTFLWSEEPISPGREEPSAGADVCAAPRGAVERSVECGFVVETSHMSCFDRWTAVNSVKFTSFCGEHRNVDELNHYSDWI